MKHLIILSLILSAFCAYAAPPVPLYVGHFQGKGNANDFVGNLAGATNLPVTGIVGNGAGVYGDNGQVLSNIFGALYARQFLPQPTVILRTNVNVDSGNLTVAGTVTASNLVSTASGTTTFTASGDANGLVVSNSFNGGTAITAKGTNGTVTINSTGNGDVTATTFTGNLTGNVTGNATGTAASTTDAGTYWGAQATLGTNTLTLNNKLYYFNAANDTSITNVLTGSGCWAVLVINNTNASTTIHTRCDVSGIGIIGTVAYTANTNGLVAVAGKSVVYSVVSMSKTNYSNAVQQ